MKSKIVLGMVMSLLLGHLLTSCTSSADKVKNAEINAEEAQKDLADANQAYLEDMASYRKARAEQIAANDLSIAEFKARIANEKYAAKVEYNKKIAELEQKNSDNKRKLDEYKADGKDNWESFKSEFNRDMEELGQALKDLTIKNKN